MKIARISLFVLAILVVMATAHVAQAQSFLQTNYTYDSSTSGITDIATTPWPDFITTAGNTVVVFARCSGSATNVFTITDGSGETGWQGPFYASDGNNNERSAMFYIQNTAGFDSLDVQFGTSCGEASLIAMELSDIGSSPLDGSVVTHNHYFRCHVSDNWFLNHDKRQRRTDYVCGSGFCR